MFLLSLTAGNYLDCIAKKVYAVHEDGSTTLIPRETYATSPEPTIYDIITNIATKDLTITKFKLDMWDDVQCEYGHYEHTRSFELPLDTGYLMLGDVFTWTIDATHTRKLSAIVSSIDNKMCYGISLSSGCVLTDLSNTLDLLQVDSLRTALAHQIDVGRIHPAVQATKLVYETMH